MQIIKETQLNQVQSYRVALTSTILIKYSMHESQYTKTKVIDIETFDYHRDISTRSPNACKQSKYSIIKCEVYINHNKQY